MIKCIFILSLSSSLVGCGDNSLWDSSCETEMKEVRDKMGAPEEVKTYNSGDYSSTDWWYWRKGIEYTFTYYKSCKVSTYTFTPIR